MFMGAGCQVEDGGLSRVGITEKSHLYFFIGMDAFVLMMKDDMLVVVDETCSLLLLNIFLINRFFPVWSTIPGIRRDHRYFNHHRLTPAQRYLVLHDLIFDGILQRGVQYRFDFLPAHKPHFEDAFPESSATVYFYDVCFLSRL
ncbi:hypothetical protein SDC9_196623 [bioreactor metagenome]|uniref:Uncharacterized protein n=1 Tax=bioreactor metagenome TaxID=1076179 RepID=A0A645ID00_9ZZZZ